MARVHRKSHLPCCPIWHFKQSVPKANYVPNFWKLQIALENGAGDFTERFEAPLEAMSRVATRVHSAWCGSNLGYHSRVFYSDLATPPSGARFSSQWGLRESFVSDTTGDWVEYDRDGVREEIARLAGNPDLTEARNASRELSKRVETARSELESILSIQADDDRFLGTLKKETRAVQMANAATVARLYLPKGDFMSTDMVALTAGLQIAPHHEVVADVISLRMPRQAAEQLASIARKAGSHIE